LLIRLEKLAAKTWGPRKGGSQREAGWVLSKGTPKKQEKGRETVVKTEREVLGGRR